MTLAVCVVAVAAVFGWLVWLMLDTAKRLERLIDRETFFND